MNQAQIDHQRRELASEAASLAEQIDGAIVAKSWASVDRLSEKVQAIADARADLDLKEARLRASERHPVAIDGGSALGYEIGGAGDSGSGHYLAFTKAMARDLAECKAVAANGAAVVAQTFQPSPVVLGKPATGLLDVIPSLATGPQFAYLAQTTRTNNAAVVADGSVKPTSVYGVTRVTGSLSVIAHLSEGIQHYWLQDAPDLLSFIADELRYGLSKAIEAKALTDINATSGIVLQSWATSIPVTLRKALTTLESSGLTASAIVLHPADFETIELALSTTNAVEHLGLPYDPVARRLYGVPIATTVAQAQGTGHVLADGAVAVGVDDHGVQLTWSETSNADDFSKNLTRARLETRTATLVYRPAGVVKATLASGS